MSDVSLYADARSSSSAEHVNDHGDADEGDDWVLDAYRAVCRDAPRAPSVRGLAAWRDHVLRCCLRAFEQLPGSSLHVIIVAFCSRVV